eukprot:403334809
MNASLISCIGFFRDSYRGQNFHSNFTQPTYQTLINSTWRSFQVAEGVSPYSKLWPAFISNDKEMDLFVYEFGRNTSWISNIRGASATLKLNNITHLSSRGAQIIDFDKDFKEDLLQLTGDRKQILIFSKQTSFHKITWTSHVLFDVKNALGDLQMFAGEQGDMRISSFLVDDINNDEVYDLVISLDITLEDGGEKTVILRAVQGGKLQFQYDKIDPECGKFLLVDTAPLEQRDYKDFVIITKSLKIALIKNFDPNWMYVEITPNFLTLQQYLVMERLSGPSFHIYIVDFDKDGYLDIVLPNTQTNKLVYLKNPGSAYWRKMSQIVYQANKQKQIQDLKVLEKWQQVQVVTSAFSDQIQDFVLVNIDSEDKLVVVVLSPNAIDFFYPFEKLTTDGKHKNITYKEKKILLDSQKYPQHHFTNIYDADVSNDNEVNFIVFSNTTGQISLIQREKPHISFRWSSNFWIYIIIFIHVGAFLLGIFHFSLIFHQTNKLKSTGSQSQPVLYEIGNVNREMAQSGWNMENINGIKTIQEGVEASEWDPSDPSKKKLKKGRKYSFDQPSNKKPDPYTRRQQQFQQQMQWYKSYLYEIAKAYIPSFLAVFPYQVYLSTYSSNQSIQSQSGDQQPRNCISLKLPQFMDVPSEVTQQNIQYVVQCWSLDMLGLRCLLYLRQNKVSYIGCSNPHEMSNTTKRRLNMPHLISNLVEKAYTPFTAKLAPRHLWSKPTLGRKPQKTTRWGNDPTVKSVWRFVRSWVAQNHKLYYTYVLLCAWGVYQFWWYTVVGYYRQRNHHRSLEFAIQKEKEWALIKPKEEEEEEEEEETPAAEGGETVAAAGGDEEE